MVSSLGRDSSIMGANDFEYSGNRGRAMSIFAIGDPHLSLGCNKEMNIFAGWHDYVQRLEQNWLERISSEDTVILAGDISWAMSIEDTLDDFTFLHRLPGEKYLMKGNHDYWWTTLSSMQRFLDKNGLNTLHFLHNNAVTVEGVSLCGSRGWMFEEGERAEGSLTAGVRSAKETVSETRTTGALWRPPRRKMRRSCSCIIRRSLANRSSRSSSML